MAAKQLERQFSTIENWPVWLFTLPLVVWWLMLAIRYRSITLPTIANPRIPLGGLCGESKAVLLEHLGPVGRAHLAHFVSLTTSAAANSSDTERAEAAMHAAQLAYPLIVKPDISRNGTGVQIVRSRKDLAQYLALFPRSAGFMLQRLITDEGEAGVFYIRLPGAAKGHIVSLTLKYFPKVVGDGARTLAELILAEPRAGRLTRIYFPRFSGRLEQVPRAGEIIPLVSVGNHAKGAVFEDGAAAITPAMEEVFDTIAREMPDFRFGRFDVRYTTLEDFKEGRGFSIVEYNGVSSEPTHILSRDMTVGKAYRDYFSTIHASFKLGDEYRAQGWRPATLAEIYRMQTHEWDLLAQYPQAKELDGML